MKITVFGAGYVGLTAAVCFADKGNDVTIYDVNPHRIKLLREGKLPIYEIGLGDLLARNKSRLHPTTEVEEAFSSHPSVCILAVGTPQRADGLEADTSYIEDAAKTIASFASAPTIIAIKSTVPVGTAQKVKTIVAHARVPIAVVSNPEFLKEGTALADFETPDRVVLGSNDEAALAVMRELYSPFCRKTDRIVLMNNESAELSKYASNIMLATRISVMNELSRLAERAGADINAVRVATGMDSRIGPAFLFPGPGYGGSCFPKDIREAVSLGKRLSVPLELIPAVDSTNEMQKIHFTNRVLDFIENGKTVAVWGCAFKAKTDDVRDSATIILVKTLLKHGVRVRVSDPEAMDNFHKIFAGEIEYGDMYSVLSGADALVVMTDWNEFKSPDWTRVKNSLKKPLVVDSRNLYSQATMKSLGIRYRSVGRIDV